MLRVILCWAAILAAVDSRHNVWSCPSRLSGFSCADGKYYCECPGDKKEVWFTIGCCYDSGCGKICHASIWEEHGCNRYANCFTCLSGIGEWSQRDGEPACDWCLPGFSMDATGTCSIGRHGEL